jgi:hypothetical protein
VKEHDKSASERARLEEHAKQFLADWPDTTQLVITGLHEEIERMRRKMTAKESRARIIRAVCRRHRRSACSTSRSSRTGSATTRPATCRRRSLGISSRLRTAPVAKLDDADLWRAKAVQLAAALEGATDRLAAACAETAATYETSRAWLVDLMGEERLERGLAGHREVVEQLTAWRTLLTGDLAEPLAKLKRLREAVERELRFDPNAVIELIAAAREVVG